MYGTARAVSSIDSEVPRRKSPQPARKKNQKNIIMNVQHMAFCVHFVALIATKCRVKANKLFVFYAADFANTLLTIFPMREPLGQFATIA